MTKFEKMRHSANMLEQACKAIMDAAYSEVRWESKYLVDCEDSYDKYDDDALNAHLNAAGLEIIDLARELVAKIEKVL